MTCGYSIFFFGNKSPAVAKQFIDNGAQTFMFNFAMSDALTNLMLAP